MQNKFRRALDLEHRSPLSFERHCDAYFGLVSMQTVAEICWPLIYTLSPFSLRCCNCNLLQAEVLQNWAEGLLAVCRSLPDAELTRGAEQQASSMAKTLLKQAVESYQQVSKRLSSSYNFIRIGLFLTNVTEHAACSQSLPHTPSLMCALK